MKKLLKKIALLMLAVSMTVPAASALNMPAASVAEAATKTSNITMYVGETTQLLLSPKSIKSSNKKVVKGYKKKNEYGNTWYYMSAKKTGKATVTVKTQYTTYKYKVTVKKHKVSADFKMLESQYRNSLLISVKNATGQTFDDVAVKYTLKDAAGNVLKEDTVTVSHVLDKKTSYATVSLPSDMGQVDVSKSSVKVTNVSHDPGSKYKDISKKIKVTDEVSESTQSGVKVKITLKNTTKKFPYKSIQVKLFDENGELIGVEDAYISLGESATNTGEAYISLSTYPAFKSYKVEVLAYSK